MDEADRDRRVAVVTGGARGIGFEIARHLAADGCRVALADIDEAAGLAAAAAIEGSGGRAAFVLTDLSSVASIETMAARIAQDFGRIDVLVNNAGILHTTPVEDVTPEEWERILRVNLTGVFFACQKVLPHMKRAGGGRIINIASLAGRMGGVATGLAYTASKAGVIGLTRGLALRVAVHKITVNAVAPSTTEGPMSRQLTDEQLEEVRRRIPLGRFARPAEVAAAVGFLASAEASYITGAVLDVNGGIYMG